MSLTRKMLKAMSIEDEKIDQIIEAHAESIEALKADRDEYKEKISSMEGIKEELEELKARNSENWEDKYNSIKEDFENYKNEISLKELKIQKEKAIRSYFDGKGITGKNLDIAMRGIKSDFDKIDIENGRIKDYSFLDDLISGEYSGLISKEYIEGANTPNPPNTNNNTIPMNQDDIMKIKDTSERQKAWAVYLMNEDKNNKGV